ncbi:MAG: aminotransferase class I/II-fold pyridoxal phosphate-dependent enzyme [Nitrosospira sp.]|nr:aminotransferase class I/II-fold pyridoxal phosphate-dependent enzyme [Nitrosospira sp.]
MKGSIRGKADLAINGAPPAFDVPLHVGRPNIGNREAFMQRVARILDDRWLTNNGPVVQEFERRLEKHLGVKHCVAMCNGTIALEVAIRALGLEGEVIVPSWTFIATAHALSWQGITPVFADIDPDTHNLDPRSVRRMITQHTTGIIGVHLWGRPAPIKELQAIADEHGIQLMFDAAHALGCSYKGRCVGNFGRCEVLSFHATKVLNTFEGGALTTNDDELAKTVRLMRNFGFSGYDNVIHLGTNAKMSEINAAMGLINFDELDNIISANLRNYEIYKDALSDIPGIFLLQHNSIERNNYHYVVAEVDEHIGVSRDEIISALRAENVLARRYFWPGCHRMRPYCDLLQHTKFELSYTDEVAERVVVLPNGAVLSPRSVEVIARVCQIMVNG